MRTDDPGGLVLVHGSGSHVETLLLFATVCTWVFLMAYVIVGNYLYFTKVLPTLSRAGFDACPKFRLSNQIAQVDLFLTLLPPTDPRPWYYGVLSHHRTISTAVLVLMLGVFMAWAAFLSL